MSTLRTTNIIHGSSAVSNIVLDNQGRAIFGPDSPAGRAALYVNAQTNRVGVNTESPSVALDVDGAINATGNVAFGGTLDVTGNVSFSGTLAVTGNVTHSGSLSITDDLTVGSIPTLFVNTASTTAQIGVGTSSPSSALHVVNAVNTGNTYIHVENTSAGNAGVKMQNTDGEWTVIANDRLRVVDDDNSAERISILSNGNVGLNNTTPRGALHIGSDLHNGTADASQINIKQTTQDYTSGLYLERPGERRGYSIYVGPPDDGLTFRANNFGTFTSTMYLNRDGQVGIGTTSPDSKLTTYTSATLTYDIATIRRENIALKTINGSATAGQAATLFLQASGNNGSSNAEAALNCIMEGSSGHASIVTLQTRNSDGTRSEKARITSAGNFLLGAIDASDNTEPRAYIRNVSGSQHTLFLVNGSPGDWAWFYHAKGKNVVRSSAERNFDIARSRNAGTNINVLIKVRLALNSAVNQECGEVNFTAGYYKSGGNYTFWQSTPTVTMFRGSGYGAGSVQWAGSDANVKILRYVTDANISYTKYQIVDLTVTGHDYAPIDIL